MEAQRMTVCLQRWQRIRMTRVGKKCHIRELCPGGCGNGIGVLFSRSVTQKELYSTWLSTRWSDRIVESDHDECTTDDTMPLVSQPFTSQAARRRDPTPICHPKTLTWSLHSPASSPVTSSRATPHHSTGPPPRLSPLIPPPRCHSKAPPLSCHSQTIPPAFTTATPLPASQLRPCPNFPQRFLLTPPPHARPYPLLDAWSTASSLRLRPRPRPRL